ncbi:hypothetical protein [Acinetobacter sp. A1]|uniref:hypothetical protein n=1 Tax=Acinetobacter sp. A1 TaxID=401467 RepID=UPI0014464603|nr:hypothetical protein [Acinetobacter sp. A1]
MKHILIPVLVVLVVVLGYLVYHEEAKRKQTELNQVLNESANLSLKKAVRSEVSTKQETD